MLRRNSRRLQLKPEAISRGLQSRTGREFRSERLRECRPDHQLNLSNHLRVCDATAADLELQASRLSDAWGILNHGLVEESDFSE